MSFVFDGYLRKPDTKAPYGLLSVDPDAAADVLFVFDRLSLGTVYFTKLLGGIVNIRVPINYSTSNDLTILIMDRDGEFNAAVLDGVKAEIVIPI
jgi:hypothetical protein